MGMLGGIGKGMQQYSQTIGKQKEMNWEAQQAQLKYQREMNLQDRRARNQRVLQEERIDKQTKANIELAGEEQKMQRGNVITHMNKMGMPVYASETSEMSKEEIANLVPVELFRQDMEARGAERKAQIKLKYDNPLFNPKTGLPVPFKDIEEMSDLEVAALNTPQEQATDDLTKAVIAQADAEGKVQQAKVNKLVEDAERILGDDITTEQRAYFDMLKSGIPQEMIVGSTNKPSAAMVEAVVEGIMNSKEYIEEEMPSAKTAMIRDAVASLYTKTGISLLDTKMAARAKELPQKINDFIDADNQQEAAKKLVKDKEFETFPLEWQDKIIAASRGEAIEEEEDTAPAGGRGRTRGGATSRTITWTDLLPGFVKEGLENQQEWQRGREREARGEEQDQNAMMKGNL